MAHNAVVTVVVIAEPIVPTPVVTIESHRSACTGRKESLARTRHPSAFRRQLAAQQVRAIEPWAVAHRHLKSRGHTSDATGLWAGRQRTTITREAAP
jgi:hypothetical protein